jgi:hypothetical protein
MCDGYNTEQRDMRTRHAHMQQIKNPAALVYNAAGVGRKIGLVGMRALFAFAYHGAGDYEALDLLGAFVDLGDFCVAHHAFYGVFG